MRTSSTIAWHNRNHGKKSALNLAEKSFEKKAFINQSTEDLHLQLLEQNRRSPGDQKSDNKENFERASNRSVIESNDDLLTKITVLELELASAKDLIRDKDNQNEQQQTMLESVQAKLALSKASPVQSQPQQVATLNKKVEWLQGLVNEYLTKIQKLETEKITSGISKSGRRGDESNANGSTAKLLNETIGLKRIQEVELEKLHLMEHIEFLEEKMNNLKEGQQRHNAEVGHNLGSIRELQDKIKQEEDEKVKLNYNIKKLVEELKQSNNNYVALQKKYSTQDSANKDLLERVKVLENDKKSYIEKRQKMTTLKLQDDKLKEHCKGLEGHLSRTLKEIEALREKFASVNMELSVMKETEVNYKKRIEFLGAKVNSLQEVKESDERDKQLLIVQNGELVRKIERLEEVIADSHHKQLSEEGSIKNNNRVSEQHEAELENLLGEINRLETERLDLITTNSDLGKEIRELNDSLAEMQNDNYLLRTEKVHVESKYDSLVREYEVNKRKLLELESEVNTENALAGTLQRKSMLMGKNSDFNPNNTSPFSSEDKRKKIEVLLNSESNIASIINSLKQHKSDDTSEFELRKTIITTTLRILQEMEESSTEWERKYHKLLVKYFKSQDEFKELKSLKNTVSASIPIADLLDRRNIDDHGFAQLDSSYENFFRGAISPSRRVSLGVSHPSNKMENSEYYKDYNPSQERLTKDQTLLDSDPQQRLSDLIQNRLGDRDINNSQLSNIKLSTVLSTPIDRQKSDLEGRLSVDRHQDQRSSPAIATLKDRRLREEYNPQSLVTKARVSRNDMIRSGSNERSNRREPPKMASQNKAGTKSRADVSMSRADVSMSRMNRSFEATSMDLFNRGKKSYLDIFLQKKDQNGNSLNQSLHDSVGLNEPYLSNI